MKEINFIRPQEVFDRNTGESKVRYTSYDGSDRFIPVVDGEDGVPRTLVVTTHAELVTMRDGGKLTPGALYRITDYQCTTTQENTRSAGHQFDIVLLALSENKLAEEGWAMMHENDTYLANSNLSAWKVWYCLDNDKSRFAWADDTYKLNPASIICDCYRGETKVDGPIDYSGKQFVNGTIYYRDEEKDTTISFMGNAPAYAWTSENNITIFTASVSPNSLSTIYSYTTTGRLAVVNGGGNILYLTTSYVEGLPNYDFPNGRGVIYRLIDEWNIDYPCDFKNMQMLVPMDSNDDIDMQNPVKYKYCYAFTDNTSGDPEDLSIKGHAVNIKVKSNLTRNENSMMYLSPGTIFYTNNNETQTYRFSNITVGIANVTIFIDTGHAITILDYSSNVMLKRCSNICIGYDSSNIMFNNVDRSTFGSKCQNIQLTGESDLNYGNGGVELATKNDIGDIETALNNI